MCKERDLAFWSDVFSLQKKYDDMCDKFYALIISIAEKG